MTARILRFPRERVPSRKTALECRDCEAAAVYITFPHVDHRRRKPWPEPFGLCEQHAAEVEGEV